MTRLQLTLVLASILSITMCTGNLPTPNLTIISPHPEVSPGEELRFKCTTLYTNNYVDFNLYHNKVKLNTSNARSETTFMLTVQSTHKGQYTCDYTNITSSSHSKPITITVVELKKPSISFSAEVEWYHTGAREEAAVTKGYGFVIRCFNDPKGYREGFFHLISHSNETKQEVDHSANFSFPNADFFHQQNYSCLYKVKVGSRYFTSNSSDVLSVTVKASLLPYIVSGATGGLVLLLVPIIFLCLRRQKKAKTESRQLSAPEENDNDPDNDNDYEDPDDAPNSECSDNSENDYLNVEDECVKTPKERGKSQSKEPVESDDSDNDYLNVETECVSAAKDCRTAMLRTAIESEDSDNDYMKMEDEQVKTVKLGGKTFSKETANSNKFANDYEKMNNNWTKTAIDHKKSFSKADEDSDNSEDYVDIEDRHVETVQDSAEDTDDSNDYVNIEDDARTEKHGVNSFPRMPEETEDSDDYTQIEDDCVTSAQKDCTKWNSSTHEDSDESNDDYVNVDAGD